MLRLKLSKNALQVRPPPFKVVAMKTTNIRANERITDSIPLGENLEVTGEALVEIAGVGKFAVTTSQIFGPYSDAVDVTISAFSSTTAVFSDTVFVDGPSGDDTPVTSRTINGATVLVGGDRRIDNLAMGIPPGLDWLTDTLNGIDIYGKGFVKTPTLFFDPSATGSLNRGTLKHPYNTQAEVGAAVSGNMAGHVLGFKRGTRLRGGLALNVCGSAGNPFFIVPYGDAEALPIISGGIIISSWILVDAGNNVWSYALGATEHDCWQDDIRLWKKAWNTNAVTTLTQEGDSTYNSSTLYIRPYNSETPNLGQMQVSTVDRAIDIRYSDVSATGYITICGMNAQYARDSALYINKPTGATAITSCADIEIVGCQTSAAGVDNAADVGRDGVLVWGPSDAVRLTGLRVLGNYSTDVLNNPIEFSNTTGAIFERNIAYNYGGNGIEMWASNSDALVRHNWYDFGSNRELRGTRTRIQSGLGGSGFWLNNLDSATMLADNTATKNTGNVVIFNLFTRFRQRGARLNQCGAGCKVQHNTFYALPEDTDFGATGNAQGVVVLTAAFAVSNGWVDISNNLFVWDSQGVTHGNNLVRLEKTLAANAGVPAGNNNVYVHLNNVATGNFYWNGVTNANFTSYKAGLAAYSFDQNSLASTIYGGGTLTAALLGFDADTYRPLAANIPGLTSLIGIGNVYHDGQPYVAASATIGALKGG